MNGKQRSVLSAIFTDPISRSLVWEEVENLLIALGSTVKEGKGSRVRISLNGVNAVFHRPHPHPSLKIYVVKKMRLFLTSAGVEPPEPDETQ